MQKEPTSVIVEYFGDRPLIRIIDFFMDGRPYDYSKKVAEETCLGVATVFKYFRKLEEAGIVKISRQFGKRLYEIEDTLIWMHAPKVFSRRRSAV